MRMEKVDRHVGRIVRTSKGTVTQVSIKFEEKGVMNMEQNTKYVTRATLVEQQVEKKTYIHDTFSQKQARGLFFFLSCVSKTQPNHWTKRMANTRLTTCLKTFFLSFFLGFRRPNLITGLSGWRTPDQPLRTQEPVPDRRIGDHLVYGRPNHIPNLVGKTDHNVGGLACILGLTNSHI